MSFVKRLWKDRVSQYPNRRAIYDGSFSKSVTVSRDEGTVTEAGDPFNAENMNDLEDRIEAGLAEKPDREEVEDMVEGFFPLDEVSGAIASFNPGVMLPLRSCECQINPYQAGTGDPTPSNVRAISGYTACSLSACSNNLWNEKTRNGYYSTSTGVWQGVTGQLCTLEHIPVKPNTTYYAYKGSNANIGECLFYDKNRTYIGYITPANFNNHTFTTPNNCHYIHFNLGNGYGTTYNNNMSINYPSIDTTYHAYDGTIHVVDWGINQWDEEWEQGSINDQTGEPSPSTAYTRSKNYTSVLPNDTYYFYSKNGLQVVVYEYDANKNYIGLTVVTNLVRRMTANTQFMKIRYAQSSYVAGEVSVNYPATYKEYYPYIPNNPGVVYNGRINATTGELIVDYQGKILNGTENFVTVAQSDTQIVFRLDNAMTVPNEWGQACSHFKFNASANALDANRINTFVQGQSKNLYIQVSKTLASGSADFKTWLASQYSNGTPVTYIATVAPIVYQLTPKQIKTLLNKNNIYHDCNGDIDVIYHKALTAKNISFDNSGTTLTATNVEDAIKEVLGRI